MPANPNNIEDRIELSGDYHDDKARIEFYTNSAMALERGQEGDEEYSRVWLDSAEKRALFEAMKGYYDVDETREVKFRVTD